MAPRVHSISTTMRLRTRRRAAGFSLIEGLVVITVVTLLVALGWPALQKQIVKTRLESFTTQVSILVQKSRSEAIRRRAVAVIEMDPAGDRIFAYVDLNGATITDPPDLQFNPVGGERRFTTDFEIGTLTLDQNLDLSAPMGEPVIDGFTDNGSGDRVIVLLPNGAVDQVGGLRLGDEGGKNYLEIRIEPAAVARIQLRKWDPDDGAWKARREDGEAWKWKL